MKTLSTIFFAIVILALPSLTAVAQSTKKAAKPPLSAVWQDQRWQKWRIKFSLPPTWRLFKESNEDHPDNANGYPGYREEEHRFTRQTKTTDQFPSIDLSITVTGWNGPTYNVQRPTQVLQFTPLQLMDAEQGTPESWVIAKAKLEGIEDTSYKEISGWKGVYTRFWYGADSTNREKRGPENEIHVAWTAYRLFEGNIQRIKVDITGKRKELGLLNRVLDSFRFE